MPWRCVDGNEKNVIEKWKSMIVIVMTIVVGEAVHHGGEMIATEEAVHHDDEMTTVVEEAVLHDDVIDRHHRGHIEIMEIDFQDLNKGLYFSLFLQ